MTWQAILLIFTSSFVHVGWNLLSKREHPTAAFLWAASLLGTAALLPLCLIYRSAMAAFSPAVWGLLVATGLCQAVYYAALAGAYRQGDMSVAYPLARSMPVILVAVLTTVLRRGSPLSAVAVTGMLLVVGGGFLLPLRRRGHWNTSLLSILLALTAACGTCGYSILDSEALRLMRESPDLTVGRVPLTLVYAFWEGLLSSGWLALWVLGQPQERASLPQVFGRQIGRAALTGIGIYLAYSLVLVAMTFVTNVSYAVALRQISIPLGAVVGVGLLREPTYLLKWLAIGVISVGLVLVSVG